MSLVLPLTPEQEDRLRREAERHGKSITEYALERLLGKAPGGGPTGDEIVAGLRADGVLGTFADRPDSPEWARELRDVAEGTIE